MFRSRTVASNHILRQGGAVCSRGRLVVSLRRVGKIAGRKQAALQGNVMFDGVHPANRRDFWIAKIATQVAECTLAFLG